MLRVKLIRIISHLVEALEDHDDIVNISGNKAINVCQWKSLQ